MTLIEHAWQDFPDTVKLLRATASETRASPKAHVQKRPTATLISSPGTSWSAARRWASVGRRRLLAAGYASRPQWCGPGRGEEFGHYFISLGLKTSRSYLGPCRDTFLGGIIIITRASINLGLCLAQGNM